MNLIRDLLYWPLTYVRLFIGLPAAALAQGLFGLIGLMAVLFTFVTWGWMDGKPDVVMNMLSFAWLAVQIAVILQGVTILAGIGWLSGNVLWEVGLRAERWAGLGLAGYAALLATSKEAYFVVNSIWFGLATFPYEFWGVAFAGIWFAVLGHLNASERFATWVTRKLHRSKFSSRANHESARASMPGPMDPVKNESAEYPCPIVARNANFGFSGIFGMSAVKQQLLGPASAIINPDRKRGIDAPRNGFLLHGEPGNGKTIFAEALAGELGIPFLALTIGDISSQWIGNMPKVLANTFGYAKQIAPCVFFIDEIDSFIRSRDTGGAHSEELKVTNTLLTEIVNLRSSGVILMGATNYLKNLDAAAIREGRFDYKVEVTPPDEEARLGLLRSGVAKYAPTLDVDAAELDAVAKRWNGFSVARLMAVCKALPETAKAAGSTRIGHAQWMNTLRTIQGRQGKVPQEALALADLVLDDSTRQAIHGVVARMKDVARIEALGGTLPTGLLFSGPSGTGKTAAARAIAKEVDWAFLPVAGPDLLADRGRLDQLFAEAKDLRPTLIFIDEADDVLRNRQYASTTEFVNKLLTLMDGTDQRVKDVVWIAATNHPDQIDPALLRSGRFTEKIAFMPPAADKIPRHIAKWLKAQKVELMDGMDAFELGEMLDGQTIADIEGVLQYAWNNAITGSTGAERPRVARNDIEQAMRVVLGHQQQHQNS